MIRITVSYPNAEGKRFDQAYYQSTHRQLLMGRLAAHGLQRVEMDKALADGAGGQPAVVACAHMIFTDLAGFQAGMAAHGREIMGDVAQYTDIAPDVLISEMAP
ncbi:EthD family reductase [Pseudaquabacterium pictum]|uniref:Ethyl tert-butyl ether degradation protein EthD n=1 Tax=Pseudaquabacterium pictum TaxID=2315236 RepID=A0A480AYV2_9BURK|nr:EthD family reductase [Rubrivivax pictus]GCL66106.1 ethyl tert-butyl ether degradation protein EthD [Rubrivivax pictus]